MLLASRGENPADRRIPMPENESVFHELTREEQDRIRVHTTSKTFKKDEVVFRERDKADCMYYIESGRVSVRIRKFADEVEIATLGPGEYFGEMAFFSDNRRNATIVALTDVSLLRQEKNDFLNIMNTDHAIATKIKETLARRKEEHLLKEKLVDITGMAGKSLHISIVGDKSMKETTFIRERYVSVVDKVLSRLVPRLEDLLLNRCVFQVYIGFNNGEVRTSTILDPFGEEIHQARKMVDDSYIDRHFAKIPYEEKTSMLKRVYSMIAADPVFCGLEQGCRKIWGRYYETWQPLFPEDITNTLSRLATLRSIPNYYLRNITLGITHDAIRMQFNCDGTHIVSSEDYQRFIKENL
jgi:CRP-like cAMP-binding protein